MGDNRDNSKIALLGVCRYKKGKGQGTFLYWAKNKSRIGMELK